MALVPPALAMSPSAPRRPDIELLRVLACAGVMLLHALLIFSPEPLYHLKSTTISPAAGVIAECLRVSTMPLFFLLAGWAAIGSLRRRDARAFLKERVRRLLVPLVTGMVLFCPFIKYIELRGGRDLRPSGFRLIPPTQESLLHFLPKFFTRLNSATWSHLWFLAYLLVISVALLPLLRRLARRPPSPRKPATALIFLPGLGLAGWLLLVGGYWPYYPNLYADWGNVAYYALCFLLGAGIAVWPGVEDRLRTAWPWLLLLAAAAFAGIGWWGESAPGRICVGLAAWTAAAGGLGLAGRYPPAGGPRLSALARAALPVYVVHHLPLLLIALLLRPTHWPWQVQAPLIWGLTVAVSLALTTWAIEPWRLTRQAMGLPAAAVSRA